MLEVARLPLAEFNEFLFFCAAAQEPAGRGRRRPTQARTNTQGSGSVFSASSPSQHFLSCAVYVRATGGPHNMLRLAARGAARVHAARCFSPSPRQPRLPPLRLRRSAAAGATACSHWKCRLWCGRRRAQRTRSNAPSPLTTVPWRRCCQPPPPQTRALRAACTSTATRCLCCCTTARWKPTCARRTTTRLARAPQPLARCTSATRRSRCASCATCGGFS